MVFVLLRSVVKRTLTFTLHYPATAIIARRQADQLVEWKMKRILTSAFVAAALVGGAQAADLYAPEPVEAAPAAGTDKASTREPDRMTLPRRLRLNNEDSSLCSACEVSRRVRVKEFPCLYLAKGFTPLIWVPRAHYRASALEYFTL